MKSIFILFTFLASLFCYAHAELRVLVSITPQKFLVERVGGNEVKVEVLVPPGANSHSYEPSARQVINAQSAHAWFRLGESFESRLLPSLRSKMFVVDQRDGLELLSGGCKCSQKEGFDPHIWLSPRLLKSQVVQIRDTLCTLAPTSMPLFEANARQLMFELDQLDADCAALAAQSAQKLILVSHPSFGYFCHDYGYTQLSIEMEGKDPTPRYIADLITLARAHDIQKIFLQKQFSPKGGEIIAKQLTAKQIYLDPYAENVLENLRLIAHLFAS